MAGRDEGEMFMKSKTGTLAVLLFLLQGFGAPQDKSEGRLGMFEAVWNKVNETFFDPAFKGLDWGAARDRYRPLVAAAESDEEFYSLVNNMLWELKASHNALVPPGYMASVEPAVFAEGGIGVQVRMLDNRAVITSVDPGSPGQKAGLRPGYVLQAIDGVPVDEMAKQIRRNMPPDNERGRLAQATKSILSRICGAAETEVFLACLDESGEGKEARVVRAKRRGVAVGPRGAGFYMAIEFEAKRLAEDIGYIRLNTLQPQFAPMISAAIKSLGDISGVIIDLRGNSGGEIEALPELFLKEKALLFLRKTREGETSVFSAPAPDAYQGPLAVLIDVTSGSASEVFAACLQALGRAAVVGERSPGSALESDVMIFPNGAVFLYPVAEIKIPDGAVLEGRGVVPDIEARLTRESLLKGVDSQLDAAIRHVKKAN